MRNHFLLLSVFVSGLLNSMQLAALDNKYKLVQFQSEYREDGTISLRFVVDTVEYTAQLHQSLGLIGRNYTHHLHSFHPDTGHRFAQDPTEPENCFYRGKAKTRLEPTNVGSISVHTCWGGFSGALIMGSRVLGLEPASQLLEAYRNDTEMHIVYHLEDISSNSTEDSFCGHSSHDVTPLVSFAQTKGMASNEPFAFSVLESSNVKIVELIVVNDFARYKVLGDNTQLNSFAVVNIVNGFYEQSTVLDPQIQIVLVGQHSFTEKDPYILYVGGCTNCLSNEVGVSELLGKFESWLMTTSSLLGLPRYDNAQLFSGLDFESGVLGYAPVGSMCSTAGGLSSGVEQIDPNNNLYSAAVVAHEMGHNFGMLHDGQENSCPTSGFIMNSRVVRDPSPNQFSSCSGQYFSESISSFSCLNNEPETRWLTGSVTCGNGMVESNSSFTEECDCGKSGTGVTCAGTSDPCCDAATCKLLPLAQCSEKQGCCKQCRIQSVSTECRAARGSCDIAEMCDGKAGRCPRDFVKGAGTPCVDEATKFPGNCYGGSCASHSAQCKSIGAHFNNTDYNACSRSSQIGFNDGNFCGKLYCEKNQQCTSFRLSGSEEQVADGVSCGNGEQCLGGNCVASSNLPSNTNWKTSLWTPETCECGVQQTRTRRCVQNSIPSSDVDFIYCSQPAPPISRPCLGCQTDPNVLLDIGSELAEKFKTKESMEALRSLIPRFGPTDFAPSQSAYQIGIALLIIPGALIVIVCLLCSCCSGRLKQRRLVPAPRRTTYFYRRWPIFALILMALLMFIFMVFGAYYNASFSTAIYDENSGAHVNILSVMDETTILATQLEAPLLTINKILPSIVDRLQVLLIPLNTSIVVELKAAAEFYRDYKAPTPYTCIYCATIQEAMIDALRQFQESDSWKDVLAMSYGKQSIQTGIFSAREQITEGVNIIMKMTGSIQEQISPVRSTVDGAVASYEMYDNIRMIIVYIALALVIIPILLLLTAHFAKKPTFYGRARSWSLELIFLYGLLFAAYLPASVLLDDSCHKLTTLEGNLTSVLPDRHTATVVQACLMGGSLLEALNRTEISDMMLLDFGSSVQLPPKAQNLTFSVPMKMLQELQQRINQLTTVVMFGAQSPALEIELVKLKQRTMQLTEPTNNLDASAHQLLANFEQIRPILTPLLEAGTAIQEAANCQQIADSYQQFKIAWCEVANTSVTFVALVCLLMICFACVVTLLASKAMLRAQITASAEEPELGYLPLEMESNVQASYLKLEG